MKGIWMEPTWLLPTHCLERRCTQCNRLLFRGQVEFIEIKCPRCGSMQIFRKGLPPQHPKRVIALNASNVDLYCAVGGKLIGRPDTQALAPEVMQKIKDLPVIGDASKPDIKQILALKPDLILAPEAPFHQSFVPVLEQAGIPVYIQGLNTYGQLCDALQFYGSLTGCPERAETVVRELESRIRAVTAKFRMQRPPRILIIWESGEKLTMALTGSFAGQMAYRLQAVNVADELTRGRTVIPFVPFCLEKAARADPDMVLLISHNPSGEAAVKFRQEVAEQAAWRGMKAVRGNRIYKMPYSLFSVHPGTRIAEALEYLASLLYEREMNSGENNLIAR